MKDQTLLRHKTKAFGQSAKPRKAHKAMYTLPLHLKAKQLNAPLSKELRKKLGMRTARAKKGDKVRVVRGDHKKKEGKIVEVNAKTGQVCIEALVIRKQGGKESLIPIRASKVVIIETDRKPKQAQATQAKATK